MTDTPSQRSKTRAELQALISRSIGEALAPLVGQTTAENREANRKAIVGYLEALLAEPPRIEPITFAPRDPEEDAKDRAEGVFRMRITGPPALLARLHPFPEPLP